MSLPFLEILHRLPVGNGWLLPVGKPKSHSILLADTYQFSFASVCTSEVFAKGTATTVAVWHINQGSLPTISGLACPLLDHDRFHRSLASPAAYQFLALKSNFISVSKCGMVLQWQDPWHPASDYHYWGSPLLKECRIAFGLERPYLKSIKTLTLDSFAVTGLFRARASYPSSQFRALELDVSCGYVFNMGHPSSWWLPPPQGTRPKQARLVTVLSPKRSYSPIAMRPLVQS